MKDIAPGLPVGDQVGFEMSGLVVGFGECEDKLEHMNLAAEFRVGFVGFMIEQPAAYAGGGYAHVQTFWQPAGRQP